MPRYIADDRTAALVARLVAVAGVTTSEAMRRAVTAELARLTPAVPLRDRFAALSAGHALPPPAGEPADKAFFDGLNGE